MHYCTSKKKFKAKSLKRQENTTTTTIIVIMGDRHSFIHYEIRIMKARVKLASEHAISGVFRNVRDTD